MKKRFLVIGLAVSLFISIINASANYKTIISNAKEPSSFAFDREINNIFISNKCTIYKYDLNGTKVDQFGSCSSDNNTTVFSNISMINKDNNGNLIVIENNKIEKFDKDNILIFSKKIDTSTDNIDIMGMVVDSNDNILIGAYQNNDNKNYIYRFDSSGNFINKIDPEDIGYSNQPKVANTQTKIVGLVRERPGKIKIAIDKNDNLFLLQEDSYYYEDYTNYEIFKIDKDFNSKSNIKIPYINYIKQKYSSRITNLTFDKNNSLLIGLKILYSQDSNILPYKICKFDNNYNIVSEFDFKEGDGEKQLYNISKISVDNDGFFILDKYNNKVLQTTIDKSDLDNDGIKNSDEDDLGTNPNSIDSDKDLIFDNIEIGKDIYNPRDTDGDGIIDALDKDSDNDGVSDYDENMNYKRNPYINENLLIDYKDYLSNKLFDKDNKNDIIAIDTYSNNIYTMLSSNNFKFTKISKNYNYYKSILDITDLNQDGLSDLIFYDKYNDTIETLILKKDGKSSTLHTYDLIEANTYYSIVGEGDFTGDKNKDILISSIDIDINKTYLNILSFGKDGTKNNFIKINKNLNGFKAITTADFNGDNISDILLQRESDGNLYTLIIDKNNIKNSKLNKIANRLKSWSFIDIANFNNDKSKDILLRRESDGNLYTLTIDNNGTTGKLHKIANHLNNGSWFIVGIGKFNNDNIDDILAYRVSDGNLYSIIVNKNNSLGKFNKLANDLKSSEWKILTIADFNGDGISDVLAHKYKDGDLFVIDGKNSTIHKIANNISENNWTIQNVADYNGDGIKDILLYRKLDGDVFILYLNNNKKVGSLNKIANNLSSNEWIIDRKTEDNIREVY